jgi:vacuolar-type H+-ATPase subunit I/STV1
MRTVIPPEAAETLNQCARTKMIERLLADIRADLMICEIEGWSKTDYLEQIKDVINSIGGDNNKRTNLANELERYNKWRRGAEDIEQPNPTELGMLIDEVVKELRR